MKVGGTLQVADLPMESSAANYKSANERKSCSISFKESNHCQFQTFQYR
jgi:hypothetical protein